jgi:hypothetical protein
MSNIEPRLEVPHGTVGYARKITPKQYESAELTIFVPFDMPTGDPAEVDDEFLRRAKHAATQAKALVFEELGLEFELGPNGVLQETIRRVFPGTTDVTPPEPPAQLPTAANGQPPQPFPPYDPQPTAGYPPPAPAYPPQAAPAGAAGPPYDPRTYDADQKRANAAWAKQRMTTHPNEFYDNRAKKASGEFSPKGPDFKHRDTGIGIWLS